MAYNSRRPHLVLPFWAKPGIWADTVFFHHYLTRHVFLISISFHLFLFVTINRVQQFYYPTLTPEHNSYKLQAPLLLYPPFTPSHTLSLCSELYLNTNGAFLKSNCPRSAGIGLVFHSRAHMCRACDENYWHLLPVSKVTGYYWFERLRYGYGETGMGRRSGWESDEARWCRRRLELRDLLSVNIFPTPALIYGRDNVYIAVILHGSQLPLCSSLLNPIWFNKSTMRQWVEAH